MDHCHSWCSEETLRRYRVGGSGATVGSWFDWLVVSVCSFLDRRSNFASHLTLLLLLSVDDILDFDLLPPCPDALKISRGTSAQNNVAKFKIQDSLESNHQREGIKKGRVSTSSVHLHSSPTSDDRFACCLF